MTENTIRVGCPECGQRYELGREALGQQGRCQCGHSFSIAEQQVADEGEAAVKTVNLQSAGGEESEPGVWMVGGKVDPLAVVEALARDRQAMLAEVGKVIVGQDEVLDQILTSFLARGHCLLLGVPGLAKTLMVQSLAQTMMLGFNRIQFTPDLMPTDITGTNILEEDQETRQRRFVFKKGAIFTNVLLADEINRTPPKTQAALLEAMQEQTVTASGTTYPLPRPFLVLATQNPLEQEGTYPLPEAQLDRFMFLVKVDYPSLVEEQRILLSATGKEAEQLTAVLDGATITRYQNLVRQVPVSEHVAGYAARLCRATRPQLADGPAFVKKWVRYGCGPRAGQALIMAAKAHVVLNGRFNVGCADVRKYALPVLRHRVFLNFAAASEGLDADAVVGQLVETVGEKG